MGPLERSSKTHLNKLVILQKRALRLINFAAKDEHAIPFLLNSKVLPGFNLSLSLKSQN